MRGISGESMTYLAVLGAALALLITPPSVGAQPSTIARIGVLSGSSAGPSPLLDAFRQSLHDLGHLEGKTLLIEYRFADAKPDRLADLAAELVRLDVAVIVTINTPASQAAKAATTRIPIVSTWVVDPLAPVASLARPGANVTGLTTLSGDLASKRLELLKETLPRPEESGRSLECGQFDGDTLLQRHGECRSTARPPTAGPRRPGSRVGRRPELH
jgi:putative ABC transport system substrate-binding protein